MYTVSVVQAVQVILVLLFHSLQTWIDISYARSNNSLATLCHQQSLKALNQNALSRWTALAAVVVMVINQVVAVVLNHVMTVVVLVVVTAIAVRAVGLVVMIHVLIA